MKIIIALIVSISGALIGQLLFQEPGFIWTTGAVTGVLCAHIMCED